MRQHNVHRAIKDIHSYKHRRKIGARVFKYIEQLGGTKVLNQIKWDTFYICKEDGNGFKKNQRVKQKPEGIKSREITYIVNKDLRKHFARMAKIIEISTNYQIGFATGKSIHQARLKTQVRKMWLIDLESAFEQIKANEIRYVLEKVFTIRKEQAIALTNSLTRNGHLVQGHPMAPALFNIFTIPLINRLSKVVTVRQYADDIIIYSKFEFVSHKFTKFIRKIFKEENWIINPKKFKFARKWFCVLGMYLDFQSRIIYTKARHARKGMNELKRQIDVTTSKKKLQALIGKFRWYSQFWDNLKLKRYESLMLSNKIALKRGIHKNFDNSLLFF